MEPTGDQRTKVLWVREPYLGQILAGHKTVEVRVGYDNILRLRPGDHLSLNGEHLAVIRRIGRYAGFEELLAHEDTATIAPDLAPSELLAALRQIYPPQKEELGAVALELSLLGGGEGAPGDRRYDALLFDMGYTLITFEPPQEVIVQKVLQSFGLERSVDEIMAAVHVVWGSYYDNAATVTFPATREYDRESQRKLERGLLVKLGLGGDDGTLQSYAEAIQAWFGKPGVIRPYPEVVEVLETLREQGYRLGIVSNWSWNLRDRVAQAGLEGFFEVVWASAYAGCNKPHPGIFHQALAQMEVPAGRALYIGDSYDHDVVGARNAGVDVALLDRDNKVDARKAGLIAVLPDSDDQGGEPGCPVIRDLWGVFELL